MASLHHLRRGHGPPLVLVHGFGCESLTWGPVLDLLAERHEVIALDLPGFGASEPLPPERPSTVLTLTDAVESFLDEQGLRGAAVAGFSMGGGIALELARRGAVGSVVAIAPIGFWTDAERAFCQASIRRQRTLSRTLGPVLVSLLGSPVGRTLEMAQTFGRPWRVPPDTARRLFENFMATRRFDDTLSSFQEYRFAGGEQIAGVPVTVAWGPRDRLLLPRQGRRVGRLLPHAQVVWLAGCGHIPFWDDPAAVTATLAEGAARRA